MNYNNSNFGNKRVNYSNHGANGQGKRSGNAMQRSGFQKFNNPHNYYRGKNSASPVISGYFVKEKSYKEIIISRINAGLCCILGLLVLTCLVSYYFVVENEAELRKLSRETIDLTYDNADMQNQLDSLQSFSNVDFQVTKHNTLQRAKQVIELSAADLPDVQFHKLKNYTTNKYLGY